MPTVLVIDDEADHRELLALALSRSGHQVLTAVDAPSAWTALHTHPVDAALIDVRLPGENGIDLCRRLRAEAATAILPIMLISADVNDHRIMAALHAGADDYLTKPFHRAELCARLDNLLVQRKAVPTRSAIAATAALLAASHATTHPTPPHQDARKTA